MAFEDKLVERGAGLSLVLLLHIGVFYSLWHLKLMPAPDEMTTLFVHFIAPPALQKNEIPKAPPPTKPIQPKVVEQVRPQQIVAQAPAINTTDLVAPPPKPVLAVSDLAPTPLPTAPVALSTELAAACTQRDAPKYPPVSQRMGEEGTVVLAVELNEMGVVASAKIHHSSGFSRLDEAGLTAIRRWRCTPTQRNGAPVKTTALQPFKFVLEGN